MDILNLKALLIAVLIFVPIKRLFALRPGQTILRKADAPFGTMYLLAKRCRSVIAIDDPIPPTYVEQLAYPFIPKGKFHEAPTSGDA
ncbi:hypothetical protein [Mesorhizobium onobrychidis]|uniref:Uncharacterized protein n=1 Tax=Mesorhizobium onobrychidis TaxID=2775404 RepID=A0ABY5R0A8_9HYPH|nr:hypothetical protein [Mesorhizobium onobrychidis]UVC16911.1 hypothetical protein IHQ72_07125 [Mesorhizobium onobrychidis]